MKGVDLHQSKIGTQYLSRFIFIVIDRSGIETTFLYCHRLQQQRIHLITEPRGLKTKRGSTARECEQQKEPRCFFHDDDLKESPLSPFKKSDKTIHQERKKQKGNKG